MAERVPEPEDDRTPFERFQDLTRRIVKVPKAEVDALRKQHEKRRGRRKSAS